MAKIKAKVLSVDQGMKTYDNVMMIRIRSKRYNLLIMEDYMATIGEIDGSIVIVTETEEVAISELKGFYMHSHNQFELLVKEAKYD